MHSNSCTRRVAKSNTNNINTHTTHPSRLLLRRRPLLQARHTLPRLNWVCIRCNCLRHRCQPLFFTRHLANQCRNLQRQSHRALLSLVQASQALLLLGR
jgi:hypothetical protein